MKALPDVTVRAEHDVDRIDGAIRGERDTAVDYDDSVIEVYSPTRSEETEEQEQAWCAKEYREHDEEDNNFDRRKSKKKHKKHHHRHDDSRIRKKHKKRKNRVDPIFLWAKKKETKIVRVVCEDYDRHNRIRLVRTSSGLWSSNPRSKVLAAVKTRSTSVYDYDEEDSQKDTDVDESEPERRPNNNVKYGGEQSSGLVDLNDNSIDFGETVCSGEETDKEQRARIDRALEMIERDPTLVDDANIVLPDAEKTCIKLPEGTTIHQVQVKAEDATIDIGANNATTTSSLPPPPPSLPLSPVKTSLKFSELTIIPPQQQHEPLNLENTAKRCAMEIRLQEPPLKKKRLHSAQSRSQQLLDRPSLINTPMRNGSQPVKVKCETDALSELKEVLSDPTLSVPDPLLVPRARLAALVASPATEIPKLLLQNPPPSLLPLPSTTDPDLLAVSLSHLRSMLQQQPSTNIADQMLWLSYDLSSKDMAGVNDDILSGMLNFLLPSCSSTATQQSFNFPLQKQQQQPHQQQQQQQWNNMYYGGGQSALPYGSAANHGFGKTEDCCSTLSPLQKLLQPIPPISQMQKSHKLRLPSTPPAKQRMCREMCCAGTSPSTCYESCCPKVGSCNPFAVSPTGYNPFVMSPTGCNPFAMSPTGCNPFAMSPTVCAGNLKTACNTYPMTDGAAACCLPQDVGCGTYNGLSSSSPPISLQRKSSVSPNGRVQCAAAAAAANQTGLAQQQQKSPRSVERGGGATSVGNDCAGGDGRRSAGSADKPQTTPVPAPVAPPSEAAGVASAATEPVHKPKIKVKKHLVDPNAKPKLLNIEGALHLAGANPQDLFSSPLWHPLFGSQEKRYGCRWQWTTPVTTSESNSPDISGGKIN